MTREELIRNLKYTMEKHKNITSLTFGTNISVMCKDILDYLEQEPKTGVLDKIRAEIEEKSYINFEDYKAVYLDDVLQIIDKYKAESEDKE